MRAWVLREIGGPEDYRLEDVEVPEPGPGEVRVALKAAGINHLDIWVSKGLPRPELPHVAGGDGSGVVEAVGPGVAAPAVGAEVVINPSIGCGSCEACLAGDTPFCEDYRILGEHGWGTFADSVVVPARNVLPKPARLSWEEAAAYGLSTGTAYRMLRRAGFGLGEVLLVVGVGGGVSSAGLLLGLAAGGRLFVTSTSSEKLDRARELGAEDGFDSTGEFSKALRAEVPAGADVVLENVGAPTWDQSMRSLGGNGRLVLCGATGGTKVELNLPPLWFKQQRIIGSTMFDYREFAAVTELVESGSVPVLVDEVLDFEDLPEALERLEAGEQFGKVVVRHRR